MAKRRFNKEDSESILEIKIKEYGGVIFKRKCDIRNEKALSMTFSILRDKFNIPIFFKKEKEEDWFDS